jgi:hypothetical protein
VSNARISIDVNRDKPKVFAAVLQAYAGSRRRQDPLSGFRPFDEDDRVLEVRLEIPPLRRRDALEPKEIEV